MVNNKESKQKKKTKQMTHSNDGLGIWKEFSKISRRNHNSKKKKSLSLVVREMQIKNTLRFCIISVRKAQTTDTNSGEREPWFSG